MKMKFLRQIARMSGYLVGVFALQCLLLSIVYASPGAAQRVSIEQVAVSIPANEYSVRQIFQLVGQQTDFTFAYDRSFVKLRDKVIITKEATNLGVLLREVALQSRLEFRRVNETIYVRPSQNAGKAAIVSERLDEQKEILVSGRVTSAEDGQPLPGVTVLVKGTTVGTATDINGAYSLNAPEEGTLVFSFIGFQNQEVQIAGRTTIDIVLLTDIEQLQEIVVVGYGTQKRRDVIGSVASIKSAELTQMPVPSLDAGLQGLAAGVQAVGTGGTPGAPVRVLVRGTNSISSGTDPLYIVDGMPIYAGLNNLERSVSTTPQSPLATINPNDIESIEVLKDAAATAIYGSRGSNGVIIITTKRGKEGKGTVDVNYSTGVSNLYRTADDIGFANSREWFQLMDQARANSGLSPFDPNINIGLFVDNPKSRLTRQEAENTQTDWFNEIMRSGSFQDLNVSASQGSGKTSYFLSANYRDDQGVLKNNRFQRMSARANLDFSPVNNLRAGTRLNFAYTKNNRVKSDGGGGLQASSGGNAGGWAQANRNALPWYRVYDPDNRGGYWNPLSGNNLLANIDTDHLRDEVEQYRALGNFFAEYSLPWIKGLSIRSEFSLDYIQNNSIFWVSGVLRELGNYATDQSVTSNNYNYNAYATYARTFGQHSVSAVFGTESQRTRMYRRFGEGDRLISAYQQLGSPDNRMNMFAGLSSERYLRAYFGRADYKFKDRYLVGLSLRSDGVSVFAPENRWGTFTALSAGWIISDEPFFSVPQVSLLKLRGSFGQTGNQNIPPNLDVTLFHNDRRYGVMELIGGGTSVRNIGNRNLRWETTNSYDVGVDFGLLRDRISGSFAYYLQDVNDMLLQVPVPFSTGLDGSSSIWANAGQLINKGIEFSVNSVNVSTDHFRWTTSFNLTTNRNEVVGLNPDVDSRGQGIITGNTITKKGGRLGAYFLAEYAGIDPERGVEMIHEIDRARFLQTGETVKTGRLIPATQSNVRDHRIISDRSGLPTYFGGITNTFNYKGFDLSILVSFMGGNYIYDYAQHRASYAQRGQQVLRSDLIGNTWTPENRNAQYPQLRWDSSYPWDWNATTGEWREGVGNYNHETIFHDRFLQKVNFVRLRNIQLGYNLPSDLVSRLKMQSIRAYVTATNLLTFTPYEGWDPEVIVTTGSAQAVNLAPGIINAPPLPHLRTFTVGVNVQF